MAMLAASSAGAAARSWNQAFLQAPCARAVAIAASPSCSARAVVALARTALAADLPATSSRSSLRAASVGAAAFSASAAVAQATAGRWPPRLKLRGLPFGATEEEVRAHFDGFALADGADGRGGRVEILRGEADGLPTGYALVYFRSWEEACRARAAKQRSYLRDRWLEMYVDWSP
mmetsp:Transcript_35577/g.70724  ORF Transcript_35577/g.70724 Transcript_35577/m.70724 type:complete len:176 (+) Transcript_35577:64-591(+)